MAERVPASTGRARAAAVRGALERLHPGMTIGLGSGRAVFALVDAIAAHWDHRPPLRVVTASEHTAQLARRAGLDLLAADGCAELDLAIDGTDEIDHRLRLVKGGGGALLREKLVIASARHVVVIAERDKLVERLGVTHRLPVEIVRFAHAATRARVGAHLPDARLRICDDGQPFLTDEGHYLLDCVLPPVDLERLSATLHRTLGVVEHGLFLHEADEALLGGVDGDLQILTRSQDNSA